MSFDTALRANNIDPRMSRCQSAHVGSRCLYLGAVPAVAPGAVRRAVREDAGRGKLLMHRHTTHRRRSGGRPLLILRKTGCLQKVIKGWVEANDFL